MEFSDLFVEHGRLISTRILSSLGLKAVIILDFLFRKTGINYKYWPYLSFCRTVNPKNQHFHKNKNCISFTDYDLVPINGFCAKQ